jgi:hypothetical protein
MIYLPDVNVWVALASDQHIHHSPAKNWFQSRGREQIAFCRITELGFLRLLTNSRVMGNDVLNPARAWQVYDELRADPQIIFLPEQAGFDIAWKQIGTQIIGGPNAWTDAYLAAIAAHMNATVVTFDQRFRAFGSCTVHRLPV